MVTRTAGMLVATVAALGVTWASAGAARAEACGNVAYEPVCQDPKTLVYCVEGELRTMKCGADEICVPHETFQGEAGCIATRLAGCGEVTDVGQCIGERTVLFCESNRVQEKACAAGTVCAFVADEGWYDCVPVPLADAGPSAPVEEGEDAGAIGPDSDESSDSDPGIASSEDDTTPVPSVNKGGAGAAGQYTAGGSGCAGAGGGIAWPLAAIAFLGTWARRRRAAR